MRGTVAWGVLALGVGQIFRSVFIKVGWIVPTLSGESSGTAAFFGLVLIVLAGFMFPKAENAK